MIINEPPKEENNAEIEAMNADDLRFKLYKLRAQKKGLLESFEKYKKKQWDILISVENQLISSQKDVKTPKISALKTQKGFFSFSISIFFILQFLGIDDPIFQSVSLKFSTLFLGILCSTL